METKRILSNSEYPCFPLKLIERMLFAFLILEITLSLKTSVSLYMMNLMFVFHITQLSIKILFENFLY